MEVKSDEDDLTARIQAMFPARVAVAALPGNSPEAPLLPGEAIAVRDAVNRRRRQFAAGRQCARTAMGKLGGSFVPIEMGTDRAPIWPANFVGSISHCDTLCCAAVALRSDYASLGIDVDDASPLEPDLARMVCSDRELAAFDTLPQSIGSSWPKIAFSAKEAYYKCYYPIAKTFLNFSDVSVSFLSGQLRDKGEFYVLLLVSEPGVAVQSLVARQGRWMLAAGMVFTAIALNADRAA